MSGTVLLDGRPLDQGLVHFEPLGGGVNAAVAVENGQFTLELHGGLPDGEYLVAVTSQSVPEGTPEFDPMDPDAASIESVERIAPDYNEQSKLRARIDRKARENLLFEVESRNP